MRPESAKLLRDIWDAIGRIDDYVRGKTRDDFLSDGQLRDALQWNFVVIGEAVSQLQKVDPSATQQIRQWQRIIAFRNQLIHGYGVIRNEITWDIVESKLPLLRDDVRRLVAAL